MKAKGMRVVTPKLLFHSDRGSQYASIEFRKLLSNFGVVQSMSRKGNCWDNAVAESFFAIIKRELIDRYTWHDLPMVRAAIFEYIEVFYNRRRRHSTNNYLSPDQKERLYNVQAAMAA